MLLLGLVLFVCQKTNAQNYADSARALVAQADSSTLSEFFQARFDTLFMSVEQQPSDSMIVKALNEMTIMAGLSDLSEQLNALLQRICLRRLDGSLSPGLKQHFTQQYAISLINEADLFDRKGQSKEAIAHYLEALEIGYSLKDTTLLAEVHAQLGNAYMSSANYEKGEEQYLAAVALEEQRGNPEQILRAKAKWAQALINRGRQEEAIPILEAYLKQAEKEKDHANVLNTNYNLGMAWQMLGNARKATFYLERVVEKLKQYNEPVATSTVLNELAKTALSENQLNEAIRYATELEQLASEHDLPQVKLNALEILTNVYEKKRGIIGKVWSLSGSLRIWKKS
ncbi:MAG: hypothetical protein R3B47_15090 [Bacteroidia bacterium]